MPALNINDFRDLEQDKVLKSKDKKEITPEAVEQIYIEKIKKLKEEYEKRLEEVKKSSFEEGYKKGKEEAEKIYENKLREEIEKITKDHEIKIQKDIEQKSKELHEFLTKLKKEYEKRVSFIDELILSSLEEILHYMYINPSNYEFLSKEIKRIIFQLKNSSRIKLFVSPSLEKYVKDLEIEDLDLEVDERLEEGNFIIEFDHVQLEVNFKEKIKILKDEIKREIKKHTKI